jgi:hypothetical protein
MMCDDVPTRLREMRRWLAAEGAEGGLDPVVEVRMPADPADAF